MDNLELRLTLHVLFALLIGLVATKWKGRGFVIWTLIGMGGSGLALLILAFMPKLETA